MRAFSKSLFATVSFALSLSAVAQATKPNEGNALDALVKATNEVVRGASKGPTPQDQDRNAFYLYKDTKDEKHLSALTGLAALPGHWIASNFVGCIYSLGIGVQPNQQKAFAHFEKAAPYYPLAAYNYGMILSGQGKGDKARAYFQNAWDLGGYEQAGAWLITIKTKRKENVTQLMQELDTLESPIGRFHLGKALLAQGKYKEAAEKLATASDYGVLGANAIMGNMYLQGHNSGTSKFFDLVTGFSHLYVEEGISNGSWKLPAIKELTLAGIDQSWFGNVSNNLPSINSEAYGRAGQWFSAHGKNPQRYKVSLCEGDRKAKRKNQY